MDKNSEYMGIVGVLLVGLVIGVGKLLESSEPMTMRLVLGRAISTMGIALASYSILVWIPKADIYLIVGLSALFASVGTSGLVAIVHKFWGHK